MLNIDCCFCLHRKGDEGEEKEAGGIGVALSGIGGIGRRGWVSF
jgi:hypothetical protein